MPVVSYEIGADSPIFADHVGEVGTDAVGVTFMVLDTRNMNIQRWGKSGDAIVVLTTPHRRVSLGLVLHFSWLEGPFYFGSSRNL